MDNTHTCLTRHTLLPLSVQSSCFPLALGIGIDIDERLLASNPWLTTMLGLHGFTIERVLSAVSYTHLTLPTIYSV